MDFVIPARFCGPPESGNGGWTSGHAARLVATTSDHPAVTVRLRTPPPLDRPLGVTHEEGVVRVSDGDHLVLEAFAAERPSAEGAPAPVAFDVAVAAGDRYEGDVDHPFPTCFACGTGREPGDGLRLRPGRVEGGDGAYAAAWTPGDDVDVETVWAALDCPGGWSSGFAGRPMVLGTVTAVVDELPEPGVPHVVMAWQRGAEGRKTFSGTSLHAPDGRVLGRAEATWISVDPTAVRPAGALT
jgi:hypothetical protein